MKVAVFGLGYVGSVTAAALARDGHEVVGVDVSPVKIGLLRSGRTPVLEPGLDDLVRRVLADGRLRATDDPAEGLKGAELSLICVGTPSQRDGSLDLSHVRDVASQIGAALAVAADDHVVVVRSTVLPGSARDVVLPAVEATCGRRVGDGWDLCVNPEFLREGTSLRDYDQPNRILVGERVAGVGARVLDLYAGIEAERFVVPLEVAEAVKYTDNAFHALKICFANEISRTWGARGVAGKAVMDIVARDRKLNASPAYLRPGFAFGGSCLPKDLRALTHAARRAGVHVPVLDSILPSNELLVRDALDAILATGRRRVALLGLAFKPDTDDLRESPFLELAERLIGKGLEVAIHDAAVSLSHLHGSNRAFLDEKIPHVARLLRPTVDDATRHAELIVLGHGAAAALCERWRGEGKVVVDLT